VGHSTQNVLSHNFEICFNFSSTKSIFGRKAHSRTYGFSPRNTHLETKRSPSEAERWGDEDRSEEEHQISASLSKPVEEEVLARRSQLRSALASSLTEIEKYVNHSHHNQFPNSDLSFEVCEHQKSFKTLRVGGLVVNIQLSRNDRGGTHPRLKKWPPRRVSKN
jgi:hypothetical protein